MKLSHARLTEMLEYEPESGDFRWKSAPRNGVLPGTIAGSANLKGYWRVWLDGCEYTASRLAWFYVHGQWPSGLLDHIDRNPLNNRLRNLRPATHAQNAMNRRPNRDGLKGVTRHRCGKFQASIKVGGRAQHLGLFSSEEAAHRAYVEAAVRNFGEYARAAA